MTCDSLQEVRLVDAQSRILTANAASEVDLYWASRGGGGGSFGIATQFKLGVFLFPSATAVVFGVTWTVSQAKAASLFAAWQAWAPNAPSNITSIMRVGPNGNGTIMMRCIGQAVGSETELRNQLKPLIAMDAPSRPLTVQSLSFLNAVLHFTANDVSYHSVYMKAKSDYVTTPLDSAGIRDMMAATASVPVGGIVLLCDSYGGKIADVAGDATAFVHRAGTQYCIQYYSEWQHAADTPAHLANLAKVYAAMRPHMPGYSYINYCDLDLPNYAQAYWGDNLPRLMAVKAAYDPQNLFRHAQSVPLPPAPQA
jgi:FAD/FMN-containing dehydrogenase